MMVISFICLVLAANLLLITLFICYHLFFLIYFFLNRQANTPEQYVHTDGKNAIFAIIVPAYNEELVIEDLINSVELLDYSKNMYDLIIVADNCTDRTELICNEKKVQCFARHDDNKRGKPYALEWIFKQLDLDKYDAFNIIDADTVLDRHYLNGMNRQLRSGAEAVQGYFGIKNPDDSWLTRLMVIPGVLKFSIRYFCKNKLNLSCPLMGNGMCFSRRIIKEGGWTAFSITENWEYYIQLALKSYVVHYCQDAIIYSQAEKSLSRGETQRKRWLRGRIGVALDYHRSILKKAIIERSFKLIDVFIELILPSYSELINWTIFCLASAAVVQLTFFNTGALVIWGLILVFIQVFYYVAGLVVGKAPIRTYFALLCVPVFLVWKTIVTFKALLGYKDKSWEKTDRVRG